VQYNVYDGVYKRKRSCCTSASTPATSQRPTTGSTTRPGTHAYFYWFVLVLHPFISVPVGTKKKAKTNHTKTKTVTSDQCELLTLSWSIQGPDLTNVPSEFPPAPVIVAYTAGGSENEYKAYMASKYKYEKWENSLILYKMRENDGNTEACKGILERLNAELYA
jgi:hypothetical protein